MNLNSYIGLMGRSFEPRDTRRRASMLAPAGNTGSIVDPRRRLPAHPRRRQRPAARVLPAPGAPADAAGEPRGSPSPRRRTRRSPARPPGIERLAGATTDLQHIVHQGMSYHDATFWVGANAVIRKRALEDIVEVEQQRRARDPPLRAGPHRHRGHRVVARPRRPRLVAAELPRAAQLQRDPARLRLAEHPAPPVGQRRPADPAEAVAQRAASAPGAASTAAGRSRCCASTTWPRRAGAASACCSCWPTRSTASC